MSDARPPPRPRSASCRSTSPSFRPSSTAPSRRKRAQPYDSGSPCAIGNDDQEESMATEIRVPTLGESVTEATIGRWFKKPGEPVKADEPLVELETDKVTLEVNAPAAGVLGDIVAKDGATVGPGAVLGSIVEGNGAGAAPAAPAKAAPTPTPAKAEASSAAKPAPAAKPAAAKDSGPAVARIAKERGVDPAAVPGTGRDGRVTKGDMLAAIASG